MAISSFTPRPISFETEEDRIRKKSQEAAKQQALLASAYERDATQRKSQEFSDWLNSPEIRDYLNQFSIGSADEVQPVIDQAAPRGEPFKQSLIRELNRRVSKGEIGKGEVTRPGRYYSDDAYDRASQDGTPRADNRPQVNNLSLPSTLSNPKGSYSSKDLLAAIGMTRDSLDGLIETSANGSSDPFLGWTVAPAQTAILQRARNILDESDTASLPSQPVQVPPEIASAISGQPAPLSQKEESYTQQPLQRQQPSAPPQQVPQATQATQAGATPYQGQDLSRLYDILDKVLAPKQFDPVQPTSPATRGRSRNYFDFLRGTPGTDLNADRLAYEQQAAEINRSRQAMTPQEQLAAQTAVQMLLTQQGVDAETASKIALEHVGSANRMRELQFGVEQGVKQGQLRNRGAAASQLLQTSGPPNKRFYEQLLSESFGQPVQLSDIDFQRLLEMFSPQRFNVDYPGVNY